MGIRRRDPIAPSLVLEVFVGNVAAVASALEGIVVTEESFGVLSLVPGVPTSYALP